MTVAIKSVQDVPDTDPDDQDKVILDGDAPQQVWVRATADALHAEFAASATGPWYRRGIKWRCPEKAYLEDYSMVILFQLVDVVEVDCEAPVLYSPPVAGVQYCAVPPAKVKNVYHFKVQLHRGLAVDPKIVVTPITGDGGNV